MQAAFSQATAAIIQTLGEPCLLAPKSGGSVTITGIFSLDENTNDGVPSFSAHLVEPSLFVDEATTAKVGDSVTLRGKTYKIARITPDAGGGANWMLQP